MKIYKTRSFYLFQVSNYAFMALVTALMLYPFVYVVSISISDPYEIMIGNVKLWPVGISFQAYEIILKSPEILVAMRNSIVYATVGTLFALLVTVFGAYPLSVGRFRKKKFFLIFFAVTMYFSGGLVPTYLLIQNLGLINTMWAIVTPTAFNFFYILILRANFSGIPSSLSESAYMDGANDITILFKIMLPLSKATLATISLFSAVQLWNDYFGPLLYLNSPDKFPLTLLLRRYLIDAFDNPAMNEMMKDSKGRTIGSGIVQSMKMALIVFSIIPIIVIYPFLQKYFTKGVLVGSLKG